MSGMTALHAALRQVSMTDLAPLRRAHHAGLAHAEGREVVMQHERFFALAGQAIDDLRIAPGAQRGDHQRLRLAAGEERRAVGAREHAGADIDGTHRLRVASVDARMTLEDALAHQPVLEVEELGSHLIGGELGLLARGKRGERRALDLRDLRVALLLLGDRIGRDQLLLRERGHRVLQFRVRLRRGPRPLRLAGLGGELVDRLDGDLHLLVSEDDGAQHGVLIETFRLGFDHEHAFGGARHHEIELRVGELRRGGIQNVLAVLVADARRADRAQERHAGNRERRGGAEERGDVGIDLGVDRKHRGDDLHVVDESFRKQRPDGTIDQTRGERLLLGGTALALEEAAGNAARGIGLFLIVDREGKEIAARGRLLHAHRGDEHHRLAHAHEDGAVGLTRELARFERYGVFPKLKAFLRMAHGGPFYRK
jgi:hypothetical protein